MLNATKVLRLGRPQLLRHVCSSPEAIVIPNRIPRGPTDILRALESTVGRDATAAHYKYHDDPYLMPMSNVGKRAFALAQESGRKAAHWVRKEHPEYFQHREAEPFVEAFAPPMVYDAHSDVTLEDLRRTIETVQIADAKLVYKLLQERHVEIGSEMEQRLLEALCYQNGDDALNAEFIEERWFKQSATKMAEKVRKTWKDGDLAEELFIAIAKPTSETYCALIQGMAKYLNVDRAQQLFEEALQKKIPLNTNTFNAILSLASHLKEDYAMRWDLVVNLLMHMKQQQLAPNLGTLNSVLYVLSTINNQSLAKEQTLKTLAEFRHLAIEPSLASWTYVLHIFCKERGHTSYVLADILNEIEMKHYEIRDLKDTNFFAKAMEVCRFHLRDPVLAERLNRFLHNGDNYNLIGDSYKESIYYRNYFGLLCSALPISEFMEEVYKKLVPHIYVPEPGVMESIMKEIDANGAVDYVPQLWSDVIVFDHLEREWIIKVFVHIIVGHKSANAVHQERFATIAWDIFTRINARNEKKMNKFLFTGEMLGDLMTVLLRNNKLEQASAIFEFVAKEQHSVVGTPQFEALATLVHAFIEAKSPSRAIDCIQYSYDSGYPETKSLALKVTEQMTLDENYRERLARIVGDLNLLKLD